MTWHFLQATPRKTWYKGKQLNLNIVHMLVNICKLKYVCTVKCFRISFNMSIFRCTFEGRPCSAKNFTRTITDFGVCYTFNGIPDKIINTTKTGDLRDTYIYSFYWHFLSEKIYMSHIYSLRLSKTTSIKIWYISSHYFIHNIQLNI